MEFSFARRDIVRLLKQPSRSIWGITDQTELSLRSTRLNCFFDSLQDQFDNLEKHTQWGIDVLEKYIKFVKERAEIELSYAKQLRNLSKKYQPKKNSKEEEEYRYTSTKAFLATLNEINDYAGQHEVISENMTSLITGELTRYVQELKQERKSHFHDGRKAQQHIETCWKQLEAARQQAQLRHQMAEDSKAEYSSTLQKFNSEQHDHYYTHIPNIFQKIQEMEERRIVRIGESMKTFAEVDRQVIPIIGKCLDEITKAAESVDHKSDSQMVIEAFKSGFEPPGDIDFEDFTQPMKRTISESSLSNSRGDGKSEPKFGSKSKGKLWPFIKKNKQQAQSLYIHKELMKRTLGTPTCAIEAREYVGAGPEDFSNLPPEQRRKKLQQKVDELNRDIQKEMDQRDALTKMKDVYIKNPQMGDAASVDHRLAELGQNIEKLRLEVQKFEGWLAEVEGRLPPRNEQARRQSGLYEAQNTSAVNSCAQDRERLVAIVAVYFPLLSSPDGSYTEEQSQETEMKVPATDFDDEFDDEEPLPTIGTCKALYTFEGQNEGTISVAEGEMLYVIEEDKGDGWTRIRRNEDEEGYVPTSYVEVYLDKNAKGAMTYI
ncbi:Fnbp1 [Columba livia]|nr:Fnbp1 [Columba livia]